MNPKSIEFLRDYNDWRRSTGPYSDAGIPRHTQPAPADIGEAIDWACEQIEQHDKLRCELLTPQVFQRLLEWLRNPRPATEAFTASLVRQIAYALESNVLPEVKSLRMRVERQWVPVVERLPKEEDGTVAVLLEDGSILTAWASYWHGTSNGFAYFTFPHDEDAECTEQVTHWAPLPPPPGETK